MCLFPQEMLSEARQRLGNIAKDPARYPGLLDGLILQVGLNPVLLLQPGTDLRQKHIPVTVEAFRVLDSRNLHPITIQQTNYKLTFVKHQKWNIRISMKEDCWSGLRFNELYLINWHLSVFMFSTEY